MAKWIKVGSAASLKMKGAAKFSVKKRGFAYQGMVIYFDGHFYGYWNRCKHVPLPLDWGDGDFFADDGKLLICRNHGALYLPGTGECVAGPCAGQSLDALEVKVERGAVYCKADLSKIDAD